MKKLLFTLVMIMGFVSGLSAQVDNYSLRLTPEGYVNVYKFPELNGLQNYTIQFWINVDTWSEDALIYNRDDNFKASLGAQGTINFQAGDAVFSVSSDDLVAGNWAQITMIASSDGAKALVNNVEAGSTATVMTIPESEADLVIGNGISGRIDELRFWKAELSSDYEYFIYNTLNKFNPQWSDLVAYYKFDQNECDNVVDYTFTYHHGSFSDSGAGREIVTDNEEFKYYMTSAYTNFSRFFDRAIDRDKYLLANDLIILDIESSSDGHLSLPYPYNEGTLINAQYLAEYEGREGVLSLDGTGQGMNAGPNAMIPDDGWTFHTWIYLEEWTPGAYIFKKETDDGLNGVSIRLGELQGEDGQLTVHVNGQDFPMNPTSRTVINTGEWVHIGVRTNIQSESEPERAFQFMVNGQACYGVSGECGDGTTSYTPSGAADVDAIIGENLNAKLDETAIWHGSYDRTTIQNYMESGCPMPGFDVVLTAQVMHTANSYWKYDDSTNPGYDYYSYKHFISIMRSAYENHRGYTIRMSVEGHTGWEDTFANAEKRKILAADLAEISEEFDGVELDFEWCYTTTCWTNYGLVLDEIKSVLPADKILAISPHYVSYGLPTQYMDNCDFFTFQVYGPSSTLFNMTTYQAAYDRFINQGFPQEKIVMSYATTTSRGWLNGSEVTAASPIGVRNNLLEGDYTPDQNERVDDDGYTRYFCGFDQTYERAKFVRDNRLKGIFYWDMGNDVKTSHQYSLVKAASFAINSNVDTLVTHVDVYPEGSGIQLIKSDKDTKENKTINIYPNPAKDGTVTLAIPDGEVAYRVSVYDTQGICRMRYETSASTLDVDLLGSGIYVVTVLTKQGNTYTGRLVKK